MRGARRAAAVALLSVVALLSWTATASAATLDDPPVADGLVGPLQFAVGSGGDIYVAQDFAGLLTRVGSPAPLATADEIAGVDVTPNGRILYTAAAYDQEGTAVATSLNMVKKNGRPTELADLLSFEQRYNPDQVNSYGFQDLTPECSALLAAIKADPELPPEVADEIPDPEPYTGILDSHPYAVAALNDGRYVVADAAGNDLLLVNGSGKPQVIAVLPPQPLTVPEGGAEGLGLPECVDGATYNFEPVPTDVEVGPDGMLYVTTLPGGPEGPELGPRGSVYRVNPKTGAATRIATGFLTATNLAITPSGTIYVTELFGDRVSMVSGGGPVPVLSLEQPAAVEYRDGTLYVSYQALGPTGKIATVSL